MLIYINPYEKTKMITEYEIKVANGCLEVSFPDELRKKIIKAAIILLDDDDFDGMDKMIKSALVRGVVREVMMEQYPEALDLLPKDENKQADAIYLMGQDVECGLSTKGFVITKNISVGENANTPVETQKFFTDEGKAPDGYVEVGLLLVFTNHYPYRDVRGFLDFKLEKEHQEIKVYIPMEATKSKGSLKKYVYKRLRDEDIDTVSIVDVNIWDEEGDDIEFEWDYPDFDYNIPLFSPNNYK